MRAVRPTLCRLVSELKASNGGALMDLSTGALIQLFIIIRTRPNIHGIAATKRTAYLMLLRVRLWVFLERSLSLYVAGF